ncbi:unnamed protein product [Mycena citricolor]|uniref:Uncharacterized protein n=1 Tax=Mycena citricolor TaxID=2018698 RepID=A0AAD2Q5G2_9AGAR|nr:unnamed protein product [Mycena citricolor]
MRQFGIIPNPEYYAALETERRQFPPVEPFSGQKAGESYVDFFARREARNEHKLEAETNQHWQTHLQREQNAKSQSCPGKKGARVFIWEQRDHFWIRRLVQRGEVEDKWVNFAESQRVYDSFANEWNLCTPLNPEAQVPYDDDNDNDNDFYSQAFAQDFDDNLPTGLSEEMQSKLNDASAVMQHVNK